MKILAISIRKDICELWYKILWNKLSQSLHTLCLCPSGSFWCCGALRGSEKTGKQRDRLQPLSSLESRHLQITMYNQRCKKGQYSSQINSIQSGGQHRVHRSWLLSYFHLTLQILYFTLCQHISYSEIFNSFFKVKYSSN